MDREQLKQAIKLYVDNLETEGTELVCLCEWSTLSESNTFGRTKIMETVNLDCPVHTKEGLILGFITSILHPGEYPEPVEDLKPADAV